ncbi:hypothetical protein F5Y16DRAFT_403195 [Xylariaceae sp. FL0255]|nr:hypothetical protein F5Y16DRAFT_403195 [Xylariaceae sp. FL0255]
MTGIPNDAEEDITPDGPALDSYIHADHLRSAEPLMLLQSPQHFHHKLACQACSYQNACFSINTAKAGTEDGGLLIAGSVIVAPSGHIIAETKTAEDELIVATIDLADCRFNKEGVFNLGKHREDGTDADLNAIGEAVREACPIYEFFQLAGHRTPEGIQSKMIECAKVVFELHLAENNAVGIPHAMGLSNKGYGMVGDHTLQAANNLANAARCLMGIYSGAEISPNDPRASKVLQGPNLRPASLSKDSFMKPIMEYREKMLELSHLLLRIVAADLPYSPYMVDEFIADPVAKVRLHYPSQVSRDESQLAGQLYDWCIHKPRLHHTAPAAARPRRTPGVIFPYEQSDTVPAVPSRFVVNIGDLLDEWAKGVYRSAVHRVFNKSTKHRYSVPFFYHTNMEAKLRPLDRSDDAQAIPVEQQVPWKVNASYMYEAAAVA